MKTSSLEQLITLRQLAEYRYVVLVSFKIAKIRIERELATKGLTPEFEELCEKSKTLLETLHEIDATFAAYFKCDGSLN